MKWIFFILLLVNIGLFVWIYPQNNTSEKNLTQAEGGERLRLLSEVDDEVSDRPQTVDALTPVPVDQNEKEPEAVTADTEGQAAAEETSTQKTQLASGTETPVVQNLSEMDAGVTAVPPDLLKADVTTESQILEKPEPVSEQKPILHCARIGPLGKRALVDQLSLRLRALGLEPELNSELTNEQEGYWVLVPPQKSRAVAIKIVERLQAAGVTDLWRFTSGKLAHAISLGLFKNESRAEIRRKSIADKGFDVEVRPRYRQKTFYWLSYGYTGDSPVTDSKWNELSAIFPGIERLNVDCPEIASP